MIKCFELSKHLIYNTCYFGSIQLSPMIWSLESMEQLSSSEGAEPVQITQDYYVPSCCTDKLYYSYLFVICSIMLYNSLAWEHKNYPW